MSRFFDWVVQPALPAMKKVQKTYGPEEKVRNCKIISRLGLFYPDVLRISAYLVPVRQKHH